MIIVKNDKELDLMRESGRILALAHEAVAKAIKPGISTGELDRIARQTIEAEGATSSFLGYQGYPATINASINEEIIHGIPSSSRILHEGDIISVDIGAYKNGFHSDAARTHFVGEVSDEAKRIVLVTRECFYIGANMARVGNRVSDISHAIEKHARQNGYALVKEFTGHGVGRDLHEDPPVPNYGRPGRGPRLQSGMTIAIEPMLMVGSDKIYQLDDDWTIVSADGKLTAHHENTLIVTDGEPEILTLMSAEKRR